MKKILSYSVDGGVNFTDNSKYDRIEDIPVSDEFDTHVRYVSIISENSYFQSQKHYVNYCVKIVKERFGSEFSKSTELLNFLYSIYDTSEAKKNLFIDRNWHLPHYYYSLKLRDIKNASQLTEFIKSITESINNLEVESRPGLHSNLRARHYVKIIPSKVNSLDHHSKMTDFDLPEEAKELIFSKPGVYKLYNSDKQLVYIGRADNLFNRVYSSIKERLAKYVSFIICDNKADAFILEPYLISTLNPTLNTEFSTVDKPTFKLEIPNESKIYEIIED